MWANRLIGKDYLRLRRGISIDWVNRQRATIHESVAAGF
jgi:hypothetical protein